MDLKVSGVEATPAELAVIEAGAPAAETSIDGRVVRSGHGAHSHRHYLLGVLAALQSEIGWISRGALEAVCRRLDIPPAEAWGVVTFYSLLRTEPLGPRVAHVCDDIACGQVGGSASLAVLDRPDVVASPCIGQCDRRPAVYMQCAGTDDFILTGATPGNIAAALEGKSAHRGVPTGVNGLPDGILSRVGKIDPTSIDEYQSSGGFSWLERARRMGPEAVVEAVKTSLLRGRGGAAFPTGVKWEAVRREAGPRYVICNADESEPGTFKDRVLLEGDPFAVLESLAIAGYAVGASKGYIYLRGEYPLAAERLRRAIKEADLDIEIELVRGQGAYVCGEETALMNSIEGFRGEPRQKPPFPTQVGLFGRPTVVNNVETLVNVLSVLEDPERFASTGTRQSTGTRLFCVSGDVAAPGVYELEMGASLGELLEIAGAEEPVAILLGGAAGSFVEPDIDLRLTFEDTSAAGLSLGSGVVMAFDGTRDMGAIVRRIARFFRDESCGQCVPCRVGTQRVEEDLISGGSLIEEIDRAMRDASICGLGQTAAVAIRSAMKMGLI